MKEGHIELISQKDKSRREMKVKSKAGKVLKSTLAASFAFSLVTANPIQILAAPKEVNDVKVDVYPKPQEIS